MDWPEIVHSDSNRSLCRIKTADDYPEDLCPAGSRCRCGQKNMRLNAWRHNPAPLRTSCTPPPFIPLSVAWRRIPAMPLLACLLWQRLNMHHPPKVTSLLQRWSLSKLWPMLWLVTPSSQFSRCLTGLKISPWHADEMRRALSTGEKVIGVNNRNLPDFNVDMGTTSHLQDIVKDRNVIFCALSGISTECLHLWHGRQSAVHYVKIRVLRLYWWARA